MNALSANSSEDTVTESRSLRRSAGAGCSEKTTCPAGARAKSIFTEVTGMNDKELLQLAAKAHGSLNYEDGLGWIVIESDGGRGKWWNPLTDDGDALRLAARLKISVEYREDAMFGQYVEAVTRSMKINCRTLEWEYKHETLEAATRLAIVRCAAKIGRQME